MIELSKKTKLIFLKPKEEVNKKIDIKEISSETIKNFKIFNRILILMPINIVLLW